jgi:chemotaxis response regulator CheB
MVDDVTTAHPAQKEPAVLRREPLAEPPIVALVCSAGGLQALTSVLRPLPADFPAAIIVLQHQTPGKPSLLAKILARNCRLPVSDARLWSFPRASMPWSLSTTGSP